MSFRKELTETIAKRVTFNRINDRTPYDEYKKLLIDVCYIERVRRYISVLEMFNMPWIICWSKVC